MGGKWRRSGERTLRLCICREGGKGLIKPFDESREKKSLTKKEERRRFANVLDQTVTGKEKGNRVGGRPNQSLIPVDHEEKKTTSGEEQQRQAFFLN